MVQFKRHSSILHKNVPWTNLDKKVCFPLKQNIFHIVTTMHFVIIDWFLGCETLAAPASFRFQQTDVTVRTGRPQQCVLLGQEQIGVKGVKIGAHRTGSMVV